MHWLGLAPHCMPSQLLCLRAHLPQHEQPRLLLSTAEHQSGGASADTPSSHADTRLSMNAVNSSRLCIPGMSSRPHAVHERFRGRREGSMRQHSHASLPASLLNSKRC